jgi:hypothetical protein
MNTTDYESNPKLLYVGLTRTAQKTLVHIYYRKKYLSFSCPATSYNDVFTIVARSRCLVTKTFLYCCAFEHACRGIAWKRFGQIRYNILSPSSLCWQYIFRPNRPSSGVQVVVIKETAHYLGVLEQLLCKCFHYGFVSFCFVACSCLECFCLGGSLLYYRSPIMFVRCRCFWY